VTTNPADTLAARTAGAYFLRRELGNQSINRMVLHSCLSLSLFPARPRLVRPPGCPGPGAEQAGPGLLVATDRQRPGAQPHAAGGLWRCGPKAHGGRTAPRPRRPRRARRDKTQGTTCVIMPSMGHIDCHCHYYHRHC
jgi:hypothetical protein